MVPDLWSDEVEVHWANESVQNFEGLTTYDSQNENSWNATFWNNQASHKILAERDAMANSLALQIL